MKVDFTKWYGSNIDPMFEPGKQFELAKEAWMAAERAALQHADRLAVNFETWKDRHPQTGRKFIEAMNTAADLLRQWFK
jgi:hypothetical protein